MYIRHTIHILSYFLIISLLCSCAYKQQQILFEATHAQADSLHKVTDTATVKYKIQSQDILEIKNLQNIQYIAADQAGSNIIAGSQGPTYQVEEDGTVALPAIGRVSVAGLSRMEASRKIEGLYRKDLLKNPIIDLKIVNLKVTVLGEIGKQGNYILTKDKTTLIAIIGEAGGLTEKSNEKNIKIIRGDKKDPQVTVINLSDIKTLSSPEIILQNNDIIYIAQNKKTVRTAQLQNLSSILQPAIIILNTALIIYTLTR
ncbi:MAG: polysaccharide biosynthesis/export family protein [Sphingobacteriaceae bacterium]